MFVSQIDSPTTWRRSSTTCTASTTSERHLGRLAPARRTPAAATSVTLKISTATARLEVSSTTTSLKVAARSTGISSSTTSLAGASIATAAAATTWLVSGHGIYFRVWKCSIDLYESCQRKLQRRGGTKKGIHTPGVGMNGSVSSTRSPKQDVFDDPQTTQGRQGQVCLCVLFDCRNVCVILRKNVSAVALHVDWRGEAWRCIDRLPIATLCARSLTGLRYTQLVDPTAGTK